MTAETIELKKYELLVIFAPDTKESDLKDSLADIKKQIKENSKGIFFEENWGLRPFSYRIRKYSEGYYTVIYFEAGPDGIAEIRSNVKLQPRVLRHLLLALPEEYHPKPMVEIEAQTYAPRSGSKKPIDRKRYQKPEMKEPARLRTEGPAPEKAGQAEEKLKDLDKTLEKILENPDIDIK